MTTVMSVKHKIGNRHSHYKENIKNLPVYFFEGRVNKTHCAVQSKVNLLILNQST